MRNLIYLFIIGSLLVFSCNDKSEFENPVVNVLENTDESGYYTSPQGIVLTNPLEFVGIEHNLFMEHFVSHLETSYLNDEWVNVEFLSSQFKTQFAKVLNDAFHSYSSESNSTIAKQEFFYNQLRLDEWFDGGDKSEFEIAIAILDSAATIKDREFTINLLSDLYSTALKESEFSSLEDVILHHEVLILTETWDSTETFALGSLAVAKHSLQFWRNYDFSVFQDPNKIILRKGPRKFTRDDAIVCADVVGYSVGGVTGAIGGSFLGPAGTLCGIFGGKAAGGFIGSGAAATAFVIYDAWGNFFSRN